MSGEPSLAVGPDEFAALMAKLGPFEEKPRLAVGVSGGADSLSLLLLAHDWAQERGGRITALTVDHGLRLEAAAEAEQVGRWLGPRAIEHRILRLPHPLPKQNVQAAARAARYRALERWCAETGTFHLLVAHHRQDQAETFLLRLARGSGLDGLAAMAPVVEYAVCRLLRPLLDISPARLRATLVARGQAWIEDPSNANPAFARVRFRRSRDFLAREGLEDQRLAATAARLARARRALDEALARLLAQTAVPHPAGYIRLDAQGLIAAPAELGLRVLAAILVAVGGGEFPPRLERLERLYEEIRAGLKRGRTLGGCRILLRRDALLICREAAAIAPAIAVRPGQEIDWDGRYRLRLPADAPPGMTLGALGAGPMSAFEQVFPEPVRAALPALRDEKGIVAVPALGYRRPGQIAGSLAADALLLRSTRPATGAGVKVA